MITNRKTDFGETMELRLRAILSFFSRTWRWPLRKWSKSRLGKGLEALFTYLKKAGEATLDYALGRGRKVATLGSILLGLVFVYLVMLYALQPSTTGQQVSLSTVFSQANGRHIVSAAIEDEDGRVVIVTDYKGITETALLPSTGTEDTLLIDTLVNHGAEVQVDRQSVKAIEKFLAQYLLPLVILAALFGLVFMLTASGGGAAEFAQFSKIRKGKSQLTSDNRIGFADVAAAHEAVEELKEIVDYLHDPTRFSAIGARAPKGVLLVGPPGTGKTLLARAVAGEAGVPFFSMSGSEFVESLVGVGAARIRDLFRTVRENAPAIVFIDELDAAGRHRGAGMGQGNDEREQTLNQLLVEMDGFAAGAGITVLGATNRPDILDPALLRPGRFDRQVVVEAPDVSGRVEILKLHTKSRPLADTVDLERVARQTPGFTGAELANLVNEAALVAARRNSAEIDRHDMEEAVDRVIAGPQRRSHVLTEEERLLVAVHEVGHAIVGKGVSMNAGVQKLSIVARGRTLGHTTIYELSDRLVLSESDMHRQLIATLGGLAAEQLVFDEISTGCEGDIQSATNLARNMVATHGMSDTLGRVAFANKHGDVFLGMGDMAKMAEISEATKQAVDHEIQAIIKRAEAEAIAIASSNTDIMREMLPVLLESETLTGPELAAFLDRVPQVHKPRRMSHPSRPHESQGAGEQR